MIRYRIKQLIFGLVGIGCSFFVGDVEAMEVPSSTGTERVDPFFLESLPTDMRGFIFSFMDLPTLLAITRTSYSFNQYASLLPRKFVVHYLSDGAAKEDDSIIDQLSKVAMYIPREWMNTAFQLMKEPLSFTQSLDSLLKQRTLLQQDKAHRLRKKILPHCSMEERARGVVAIIDDIGADNLIEYVHIPLDKNMISLPLDIMLAAKSLYTHCSSTCHWDNVNLTEQDFVSFIGKLPEADRSKLASARELLDPQIDGFANEPLMRVIKDLIRENSKHHYYCYLPRSKSFEALAHMTVLQVRALVEGIERTSSENRNMYFFGDNLFESSLKCEPEIIPQIFELGKKEIIKQIYYPKIFEIIGKYPKSHHPLILTLMREYNAENLQYMVREFSSISADQLQSYLQVSQSWPDKREQNLSLISKALPALSPEQISQANRLLKTAGEGKETFCVISPILPDFNPEEIHWLEGLLDHWSGYEFSSAIKGFHRLESSRRDYLINQRGDVLWRTCQNPTFALKILEKAPDHCFSAYFQIACKVLCLIEGAPDQTKGHIPCTEDHLMKTLQEIPDHCIKEWCDSFLVYGDKLVSQSDGYAERYGKLVGAFYFLESPFQLKERALWNQSTLQGAIFSVFGYSLD